MGPPPVPLAKRFWPKVNKDGPFCVALGSCCWSWIGQISSQGYGIIYLSRAECDDPNSRLKQAHREAYEMLREFIPPGLTIDHLCRNRACVNPEHMEVVTRGENTLRGDTASARNKAKTQCPKGHQYIEGNIYYHRRRNGAISRDCKICTDRKQAIYNARVRKGIILHE